MKKKIFVRGTFLSRSGYGEQARFALRALRKHEDRFNIFLQNTNWGQTSWLFEDNEERRWIDFLLGKTIMHSQNNGTYDISLQITIPNEWQQLAPENIGYTAGIETTKVSPHWLERSGVVNKIITISEHSKQVYEKTFAEAIDKNTGQKINLSCRAPIDVVNYPVRSIEPENVDLELTTDFNFLAVAQWGPRKNIKNTIRWFIEEFIDQEVGLIVKTNFRKNCILDRNFTTHKIESLLRKYPERKCKVYLLHGDMSEEEMAGLYTHPQVKALVTLTHGEGFGLPIFEAAYYGTPVIAPDWSGQCDFLFVPTEDKKGKVKNKAMFAKVDYEMVPVDREAVWEGVIEAESMWCEPKQGSYKMKLREMYKDYGRFKSQAKKLQKFLVENFTEEQQYKKFVDCFSQENVLKDASYIFVSDMFSDDLIGGAELSLEALISKAPESVAKIKTEDLSEEVINAYSDKKWIFGNYAQMSDDMFDLFVYNEVDYSVVEFDYKFCKYRNLDLHKLLENEECNCAQQKHGKTINKFLLNAENVFFMSQEQLDVHNQELKELPLEKQVVLSSVFQEESLEKIKQLREKYKNKKNEKWVISDSPNWVKGAPAAKKWCDENKKDYVALNNLSYDETLELLAASKGLCFLPAGADTCHRLVIEAKLLGCELEMNENVQHLGESWFKTENLSKIEDYIKEVPDRFWNKILSE